MFTNWVMAAPLKEMTADEVVRLFFHLVIKEHGCPEGVLSDNGTQFMSKAFTALTSSFNIQKYESSPYHHQTRKSRAFYQIFENNFGPDYPAK